MPSIITHPKLKIPVAGGDPLSPSSRAQQAPGLLKAAIRGLEAAFDQPFWLIHVDSGEASSTSTALALDFTPRLALLQEVARRDKPEIVEEEAPLSMLAVPLGRLENGVPHVAVSVFLNMPVQSEAEMASAARVFGVDAARALAWARQAETWAPRVLLRLADATLDNLVQRAQLSYLEHEINEAVAHARDTYAELGLLHRLARRLNVSQDDGQLWRRTVEWLAEAMPAQCLAVIPRPGAESDDGLAARPANAQVIQGECPLSATELAAMIDRLGAAAHRPLILNRSQTSAITWAYPMVRELAAAPIADGRRIDGWLLAINHSGAGGGEMCEFGSAEVRLLESASTLLGIHRSNTGLFHRQADLFDAAVRALISAIDAKDRYTHGHSERVARVAACLADEMRLSKDEVSTIYLGGLLHDIGKIGIDDHVLNKPGALSPEEFEHVKQHPQLGYDILQGVRQLQKILPIVLHHHEAWDGSGYPHGLQGDQTPLLARVVAVADAFDAMSSDRPYRTGMPDEKIDSIFRDGAGKQWDADVIDAFFAVRDQIRQAARDEAFAAAPLDATAWVN
jgi:HD-GYP domain-containing protein (c-di-GMP phosphodiesterase class II)